uniref:Uncharacterized protein n=1 Tax=Romanomermis culicivorax TaxID=13658 RepID=A0A915IFN4_ROMCU
MAKPALAGVRKAKCSSSQPARF